MQPSFMMARQEWFPNCNCNLSFNFLGEKNNYKSLISREWNAFCCYLMNNGEKIWFVKESTFSTFEILMIKCHFKYQKYIVWVMRNEIGTFLNYPVSRLFLPKFTLLPPVISRPVYLLSQEVENIII